MGKLVFAGFVLLVGLALYGVARRQPLFASGPLGLPVSPTRSAGLDRLGPARPAAGSGGR